MRKALYAGLVRLPFKLVSGVGWLVGLLSAAAPDKVQQFVGQGVSAATIQGVGIALLAAASVYFALLWLLKPPQLAEAGGNVFTGPVTINQYQSLPQMLADETVGSKPVEPVHHDATGDLVGQPGSLSGSANVSFEVTGTATGVTGLIGLYVGDIIVAAGPLESEHRLDIAIRGYNGTGETIRISDVSGRIRAGVGNKRDDIKLSLPVLQGVPKAAPGEEFLIALRQSVPGLLAHDFLQAWGEGKHASLDMRELTISVVAVDNPDKAGRLPLWDGVNLRRVDDIVANRNSIMAVGMAIASSTAFGAAVVTQEGRDDPGPV